MNKSHAFSMALVKSPFLWGILAAGAFYALLQSGLPGAAFCQRYCASHQVEFLETILFFIGLAALGIRAVQLAAEAQIGSAPLLGPMRRGGQPVAECETLLLGLRRLPAWQQDSYLVRRLRDALEYVWRNDSADSLEERLKFLADQDAARQHAGYGLVRLIIWAIPILGFLGTVIGIALALGNLSPKELEKTLPDVMAGLTVAFDTTALALSLSMILMFVQFLVERQETALLEEVDRRVDSELIGRFEQIRSGPDGELVAVRRMVEAVVRTTETLVERQIALWRTTIEAAYQRWEQMTADAGKQLQAALAGALAENLKTHAQEMVVAEQLVADKNLRNWERVHQALQQNTEVLGALQKSVVEQADVLGRAVEAAGQVMRLEDVLNQNLAALAGARHFEEMVMSLAAAIQLLSARLGELPASAPAVRLEPARRTGQAA